MINQCDTDSQEEFYFDNIFGEKCRALIINTTERGLSNSRNHAIRNAIGKICLFCDDDEVLESNYVETITNAFKKHKADIIVFKLNFLHKKCPNKIIKLNLFNAGNITSPQIAINRIKILSSEISFCEKMGSGTGNGAGEENKFICDSLKLGLKAKYVPELIGKTIVSESHWFHGYNETYWINRGWTYKMIHGKLLGSLFIAFATLRAHKIDTINKTSKILIWLIRGFRLTR